MIDRRCYLLTAGMLLLSLAQGCMAFVPKVYDNGYRIIAAIITLHCGNGTGFQLHPEFLVDKLGELMCGVFTDDEFFNQV